MQDFCRKIFARPADNRVTCQRARGRKTGLEQIRLECEGSPGAKRLNLMFFSEKISLWLQKVFYKRSVCAILPQPRQPGSTFPRTSSRYPGPEIYWVNPGLEWRASGKNTLPETAEEMG
jgi:hypothetical protein